MLQVSPYEGQMHWPVHLSVYLVSVDVIPVTYLPAVRREQRNHLKGTPVQATCNCFLLPKQSSNDSSFSLKEEKAQNRTHLPGCRDGWINSHH